MKKLFIGFIFFCAGASGFLISWYHYKKPTTPSDNIQVIETFHYPTLFVKQLKGDPLAGKKIFKEFCSACHGSLPTIDVNAPRINDKSAWVFRKKLGKKILLQQTIMGIGAMPARGGCFECSDEQLQLTIDYMLKAK